MNPRDRIEYPHDVQDIRTYLMAIGGPTWLVGAPDWVIAGLWSEYSDDVWSAGWITGASNQNCVYQFAQWVEGGK